MKDSFPSLSTRFNSMNLFLLHGLNVLSIILEFLFNTMVTLVVLTIVTYQLIKAIDWSKVAEDANSLRNKIGQQFVYSY